MWRTLVIAGLLGALIVGRSAAGSNGKITDTPIGPVHECRLNLPDQQLLFDVLDQINEFRYRSGLGPLRFNTELSKAAMIQSIEQAAAQMLSHTGRDGSDFVDRVGRTRYRGWPRAENVAWNYPTAGSVVRGWINSPGHAANLTLPDIKDAGIGYVCAPDRGAFWTLVLGQ